MKAMNLASGLHNLLASAVICISANAIGAPFCAVTGAGHSCLYYDVQSCRIAAGPNGACVANTNADTSSYPGTGAESRTSPRFIDRNPVLDGMREGARRRAEAKEEEDIEPRRKDLSRERPELDVPRKPPPDPNAPYVLICSIDFRRANREVSEVSVAVDLVKQTVDGQRAQISEAFIKWEKQGADGLRFETTINRLSGTITVFSYESQRSYKGRCEAFAGTDRRF